MMYDSRINVFSKNYSTPVITSSGTFGYGFEFNQFYNTSRLGAITTKAITLNERKGNPENRVCETEAGFLNSIGLQNKGLVYFKNHTYPEIEKQIKTHVHANISGETVDEFVTLIEEINGLPNITAIELNVSCPNLHNNKIIFGTEAKALENLVSKCSKISKKSLIVKLSPNVTSISEMAIICEANGANALSLVNTFLGMKINIQTQRPYIANTMAGYSGIGIKPIVVRMIHEVYKSVKIPIIGMGGVSNYEDVVEFMLAGASLVGVGIANLNDPHASQKIILDFQKYLNKTKTHAKDLIGAMKPYFD